MKNIQRITTAGRLLTLALLLTVIASQPVHAQTFTVLYTFGSVTGDASNPRAGVIRDPAGNLYGTTFGGSGAVFELTPTASVPWTETILHTFTGTPDGANPTAGLVRDSDGNLYGTTFYGGSSNEGTVFKLAPVTGGGWTEIILYSFSGGADGAHPYFGSLLLVGSYLYGTTYEGGDLSCNASSGCGVVFRVKTSGGHESVLHSFNPSDRNDGAYPYGGVIRDRDGNLYGVTYGGGSTGAGVVFELSPVTGGGWTETLLYTFSDTTPDGVNSCAGLVRDAAGNLFGTTSGENDMPEASGTVFEVDAAGNESLLHFFAGPPSDGANPKFNLILDAKGNLYGTTPGRGTYNSGVIFELSPTASGWEEAILYNFTGGADGSDPQGTLLDSEGNLYGTTYLGGISSGVVFKFALK
jgi:uncharacterized repeat protein (TIGR03803 family)